MNEVTARPATRRRLSYLDVRTGRLVEAELVAANGNGAEVKLETAEGAFEARLLRSGSAGHRALDNEIITGLRLRRRLAGRPHPGEVAGLIGYNTAGGEPFALAEPYRGDPCGAEAGRLLPHDLHRFQVSLLVGVRLLAAAGIVHRALGPRTVRWDGDRVQITGFAHAAVPGEPRTAVGAPPWSAPEQHPEHVAGDVTDRDDLWAVGRLILYMATGEENRGPDAAELPPELGRLVDGVFAPPGERPAVTEMLRRVEAADPVPYGPEPDPGLVAGRREFFHVRQTKDPKTAPVREGEQKPETGGRKSRLGRLPSIWREKNRPSAHWAWLAVSVIALLALAARLIGG
ncbi:hypothetical protein [Actinomadura rubrisoli]|uniref:Protein kinase domain-containing protein n=1 Tax=Actinomadura rubrisoli TaxID=2530368 RepID=A0A4R5C5X4_9ACTN|nr:hypothetical protein [Actinomadura rubrisoli]TDD93936.1 hypothetical protein E1298_07920 [Actinomadura rubrisoli]